MQDLLANGLFPNPVNQPSARKCKPFSPESACHTQTAC